MIYNLTIKEKKQVSSNLQYDLLNGTYSKFPHLESRLKFISEKLISHIYIINCDDLSRGEYETLSENRYLEPFKN